MGIPRTRTNAIDNTLSNTMRLIDSSGNVVTTSVENRTLFSADYCEDQVNSMSLLHESGMDIGGAFLSLKSRNSFPSVADHAQGGILGVNWVYDGPITAYPTISAGYIPSNAEMREYIPLNTGLDPLFLRIAQGSTAISRCRPAQPQASLSTALAEMYREGIPNTLKQFAHIKDEVASFKALTKAQKGKTVPSKYLEYQFGWKPLVSDIRKASRALLQQEQILEDLRRNSGKRMRRRYTFPAVSDTSELYRDNVQPWPNPVLYVLQQAGQRVVTRTISKRTWFSGEFIYTYPGVDAPGLSRYVHGARQLLGLDLTPETIWNIAPWTWFADWFANVGDVVSNFTAIGSDNLVLRYGYLMQEATSSWDHVHHDVSINGTGISHQDIHGSYVQVAKSRIAATPYGFGLSGASLDARQIAILASIGLTRNANH